MRRKPKPSPTFAVEAAHWYAVVALDADGNPRRCVECGRRTRRVQAHHVLTQQILRNAAGRLKLDYERFLRWHPLNGVPVCPDDHEAHTNASRRLSRSKLPTETIEFAELLGLDHRLDPPEYRP